VTSDTPSHHSYQSNSAVRLGVIDRMLLRSPVALTPRRVYEQWPSDCGIPKPTRRRIQTDLVEGEAGERFVSMLVPATGERAYRVSIPWEDRFYT
jgi:hypothetical protein